jgi:hypothetical protein
MAARALSEREVRPLAAPTSPPAYLAPAMEGATPVGSPAVHLQQFLEAELAAPPVRKWPPAATLAFIVLTCGGFWAAVVVAALKLL